MAARSSYPPIQPPKHGARYSLFVPRPDKDGMSVADVRPLEVGVPIGTNTGWNVRLAGHREGDLCGLEGIFIPFAKTRAERMVSGDPRLSLQERYHDHAGFVAAMKNASQQLARERYLLPEDADEWVAAAEQSDVLKSDAVKTGPPT
jgi:hypothetical protein